MDLQVLTDAITDRPIGTTLTDTGADKDTFVKSNVIYTALSAKQNVIENKDARGIKYLWMQLTVRNDVAAELAEEAGLEVVMDRCPKIEFGRLSGELSWLGVNSGIITAKTLKSPKSSVKEKILLSKAALSLEYLEIIINQ